MGEKYYFPFRTGQNLWEGFLELLFPLPVTCLVCGEGLEQETRKQPCDKCRSRVIKIRSPFCPKCGRHYRGEGRCLECRGSKMLFESAQAVGLYAGVLRECIHLFKYKKELALLPFFQDLMFEKLSRGAPSIDYVLPVPLHKKRETKRGFNQAELLAKKVSLFLNKPMLTGVLRRSRETESLSSLNHKERREVIRGAFSVKSGCNKTIGSRVLLVDDVYTSGITLSECSRTLAGSGVERVYGLTLAIVAKE